MERSKNSQSVKKVQPCDICGHVGYPEYISTCCICHRSREHIYCMRNNLKAVPEKWICEACPIRKDFNVKEPAPKRSQSQCLVGPSKLRMESNMRISNKNRTGKVKFLPTEDVRRLNSGTKANTSTIRHQLGLQTSSARTLHNPISKRLPVSVAEASKRFSQKASTHRSTGPSNPSALGSRQLNTSLQPQVSKTSPQLHVKEPPIHSPSYRSPSNCTGPVEHVIREKPIEPQLMRMDKPAGKVIRRSPNKELVCTEEPVNVSLPSKQAGSSQDAKEKPKEPRLLITEKSAGKEVHASYSKALVCMEEPVNGSQPSKQFGSSQEEQVRSSQEASLSPVEKILSRFEGFPNKIAMNSLWMGSFEITNDLYEGLQAHPPGKIHPKAYKFSKQMPSMLKLNLHPRCNVWPEIFHIDCPTEDDIALYFLPCDFGRSKDKYTYLLDLIEVKDLAMQSFLNGVELLIFTSKQLPVDSQRIKMKFYLWGVFRSVKKPACSSYKALTRSQQEEHIPLSLAPLNAINDGDAEEVDMEIDMMGGIDVGKIDKPIPRLKSEQKKVKFKLETPMRKYIASNALDRHKNSDQSAPQPSAILKTEPPNALDAPPGFSKSVIGDAAHNHPMEKPLARTPNVARNLASPPGFYKPLKMNERQTVACNLASRTGFTEPFNYQMDVLSCDPAHNGPPGFSTPVSGDVADNGPPGFSKPVTGDAAHNGPMEKPLARIPTIEHNLASPPGFSKPLNKNEKKSGDATHNGPMEKPLARMATVACNLACPPGFLKPFKMNERAELSETNINKEKAVMVDVNPLRSSKMQNSIFTDTSKRDFKRSSLQPRKSTEVLKSPELPLKCHQVAVHGPPTHSVGTGYLPLSERGKKGFDTIQKDISQYNAEDGLLGSPSKSFPASNDSRRKTKGREQENIGLEEHEKNEPSTKRRHRMVAELCDLFPRIETKDQGTENKLEANKD